MGGVLGAAGGFCAGSEACIDHQRLSSQAYCFSASLPALLARCALENLLELEARPELAARLSANTLHFRSGLEAAIKAGSEGALFEVSGHPQSPILFLRLKSNKSNAVFEGQLIDELVRLAESHGLLCARPAFIENEERLVPRPALKVILSAALSPEQIDTAVKSLAHCISECKIRNY